MIMEGLSPVTSYDIAHPTPCPDLLRVFDSLPCGVVRVDCKLRHTYVNAQAARMLGRPVGEILGRTLLELTGSVEVAGRHEETARRVIATGRPARFEFDNLPTAAGEYYTTQLPEFGPDGEVSSVLVVAADVTPIKRAEAALREREARFRAIFDSTFQYIGLLSPDGTLLEANRAALVGAGVTAGEVLGRPFWEAAWWQHNPQLQSRLIDAIARAAAGEFVRFEATHPLADGSLAAIDFSLTPVRDEGGAVVLLVPEGRDVTDRKRAEDALAESEARFRAFLHHLPGPAWVKDADGRHLLISAALEPVLGPPDRVIGRTLEDLCPPDVAAPMIEHDREVIASGRPLETVEYLAGKDGAISPWMVVKFPVPMTDGRVGVGGVAVDLTNQRRLEGEQRRLEQRLYEAQRLESLGVLAGGIAHDFNNLLTGVLGFASLAQADLEAGQATAAAGHLAHIQTAAARAAELCRQMLAYAGRGRFEVRPTDLNGLIEETTRLLAASVSKSAALRFDLAADLPAVGCDASQIRQVVMNLITNASEALPDGGGTVVLTTAAADMTADELAALAAAHLPPGRYVRLAVTDDGCGMDAETVAKVFDPFFTTKFAGRGLGLSAVQGIVRAHGGAVAVASAPGTGTTFTVLLPAAGEESAAAAPPAAAPAGAGRGRRVLVVDDEEDVRVFARAALEQAGFEVELAADGAAAAAAFRDRPDDFAAVLMDVTMPHLDGAAAMRQLRRTRGDVPVVLMSGYAAEDVAADDHGDGPAAFLRKPFRAGDLLSTVSAAVGP